ncbi:MAG: hypothetical protein QRY72_05410 [Candidatus Rhabdochlamydia sp.]
MKNYFRTSICFCLITVSLLSLITPSSLYAEKPVSRLKKEVNKLKRAFEKETHYFEGKVEEMQHYIDHYPWKGFIENKNQEGALTLQNFTLNGHSRAVIVEKGDLVECEIEMSVDPATYTPLSNYHVVIGLKGKGPQALIGNNFIKSCEKFQLIAPQVPGVYEVRYRLNENLTEKQAFCAWINSEGKGPPNTATIGLIIVKP